MMVTTMCDYIDDFINSRIVIDCDDDEDGYYELMDELTRRGIVWGSLREAHSVPFVQHWPVLLINKTGHMQRFSKECLHVLTNPTFGPRRESVEVKYIVADQCHTTIEHFAPLDLSSVFDE